MKCSKCGYLGFEASDRCRNCGYDFSLAAIGEFELDLRGGSGSLRPLDDLAFVDRATAPPPAVAMADAGLDLDRVFGEPAPAEKAPTQELPLFGPPIPDDDRPLITKVSPPRSPIAVRRATPPVPRLRAEQPRTPTFDMALDPEPAPQASVPSTAKAHRMPALRSQSDEVEAGVAARLVAVAIDMMILALIDAAVIYFTMQICGLTLADLSVLPKGPLLAFLLVQNGGYLVAFTAGGQTLGKMAVGIRVVPSESDSPLDLGRAFLRTLMWLLLAVPAGLGFFTALFGRDHRGLHDRFAGTRVVRSAA
jgi:uncharacterized RDD family membrane protein YckC